MKKLLIIFRLYDRCYSNFGNKATLSVTLRPDATISYSHYGGWQDSGIGYAISNLQLKEALPINSRKFKSTGSLSRKIQDILRTGCGSNDVASLEVLNNIKVEEWQKQKA